VRIPFSLLAILAFGAFAKTESAMAQTYQNIDFPGSEVNYPAAVNLSHIVGIYYDSSNHIRGFLRARGIYSSIDVPSATFGTYPVASNEGLEIAGYYYDSSTYGSHGFVRSRAGAITTIDFSAANPLYGTYVAAMNDAGSVIGFYSDAAIAADHGFYRLSDGQISMVEVPGEQSTEPTSINDGGTIVGVCEDPTIGSMYGAAHVFMLWPNGTYTKFDAPGNIEGGFGLGPIINDANNIVGNYLDAQSHSHGFLRTPDGLIRTIDYPGTNYTTIVGIDRAGEIAGGYLDSSGNNHGFVRSSTGRFTQIDFPGATVADTSVLAIGIHGELIGTWTDRSGPEHGFVRLPRHWEHGAQPGDVREPGLGAGNQNR
jgi:hypothetical protein